MLTDAEQDELLTLLDRTAGGESLASFIDRIAPREPLPDHARPIADAIEMARSRPIRLCVSWPPGHAKTTTLLRSIAWWLSQNPADTCAYVTYSDAQSRSKSRLAREWAIAGGVKVMQEFAGLSEWRTLAGGGMLATGARGRLVGQRVPGLLVVDDPYKNRDEVESEVVRERIWERFREVALTRLQGGSAIVLHTRWSEDDLIGRCVSQMGWDHINLPALALDDDPLGREVGEALWPEHYPASRCDGQCGHDGHLEDIRADLDEWSFGALYQGQPRPRTGGMFKRAHFQFVEACGVPRDGRVARGWDLAASTGRDSAYTCGVRMRLTRSGRVIIEDVRRIRGTAHQVEQLIMECARDDGPDCIQDIPQDPGQAGKAQKAHLASLLHGHRIQFSPETGSKEGRASPLAAQNEAGNVALVLASWNDPFMTEAASFPVGRYKDQIDAASRGYSALIRRTREQETIAGPEVVIIEGVR